MTTPDLQELRDEIDSIDERLLQLISRRVEIAQEVAHTKLAAGESASFYRPEREAEVLNRIRELNQGPLTSEEVVRLFREIMSTCLAKEKPLNVAFLGPEGTFTQTAAIKHFGHAVVTRPHDSISQIFREVESGESDFGVVPIENSTEGAISHTLDLFVDSPLQICAQILLRIENGLMACIPRESIKTLYSHPQVFGQCRNWILRNFPQADLVEVSSTTKAAAIAKEKAHEGAAALGGQLAADLNGLTMLETSIQDRATNTTRFLVIGEKTCPPTGHDRTSILFSIHDRPGSLVKALQAFDKLQVNMSKIESRPSKQRDWEYIFYVDLAGHCTDPAVAEALSELEKHCSLVKMFGSYPDTTD